MRIVRREHHREDRRPGPLCTCNPAGWPGRIWIVRISIQSMRIVLGSRTSRSVSRTSGCLSLG